MSLLLGKGDGTFQSPSNIPVANGSVSHLAAGDFDGDGNADLAVQNDSSVSILLSNGDGTFRAGDNYAISDATSLAVGDFNGDHKLDIAVGTRSNCVLYEGCQGTLSVFLGNGDGTFRPSLNTGAGGVGSIVTGDFNGDGKLDVAIPGFQLSTGSFIEMLLGHGDGTFQELPSAAGLFPGRAGDFNGDSRLDLSVLNSAGLSVRLGNGDGTFQALLAFNLGTSPTSFEGAIADLNGDGLADVLALDPANNLSSVILNTTPGFSLVPSPSTASVKSGGSATYTINVGRQNGFETAAALTCYVPTSLGVQCSVSPASVSPGSSARLTVTTSTASAALRLLSYRRNTLLYALCLPCVGLTLLGIGIGSAGGRRNRLIGLLLFSLLFGGLALQTACGGGTSGGGGNAATPSGNYTITVTGTSGSLQRSTTVTLTVQ